jgi:hypothetical protein
MQGGEVPTPDSSFDKVPDDRSLRVRMSGGESHIYNETPNDRSHIDKSKHADIPNGMPTEKSKQAVMPAVAGMHTDGVKLPPPPEPPPPEPPPIFNIFNFKAADHLVICALYACENYPLDEPSWKYLMHIAKWETKFTRMINNETLRSYNTPPGFKVPRTYGKSFALTKEMGSPYGEILQLKSSNQIADLSIAIIDPKDFKKHKSKLKWTGPIFFHLVLNFTWDEDNTLRISPTKYIDKLIKNYEKLFGMKPPLEKEDHPELDTSELCSMDQRVQYQSKIGVLQWIVMIGRFDIHSAVVTMSQSRIALRVGHLNRLRRTYGYLLKMKHASI